MYSNPILVIYILYAFMWEQIFLAKCLLFLGTCMCVKCNVNYLVAGFEQGSIVLFDYRKQLEAVTELKVHDEPGAYSCVYTIKKI